MTDPPSATRTTASPQGIPEDQASVGVSAVERAMRIVELLSATPHGAHITDLSRELGINKALVFKILMSLVAARYVYKDEASQTYRVSSKLLATAFRYLMQLDIYDALLPILRQLAEDTGELAELIWLQNDRLVIVAKAESPRRVKVVDYLGEEQHLHATASGKVYLAGLPEEAAIDLLRARGMPRLHDNTITDLDRFRLELARVRAQGYATNVQETGPEVVAVAAPITTTPGSEQREGRVVGAVSVVAPAFREVYRDERVIELTRAAAAEIGSIWPFLSLER
jgi:IclR family acetate operon transcriptional repressor